MFTTQSREKSQIDSPCKNSFMLDSEEIERRVREMLENSDEELFAQMAGTLQHLDERSQKIEETLEELLAEVDRLLLRLDAIEDDSLRVEEEHLPSR
jgi:seryl-tRNA synthetase